MTDDDIKIHIVDKKSWAENWVRPILVASIPSFLSLWGIWFTIQNQNRLDTNAEQLQQTKRELDETKQALEDARRELEEKARSTARAEVESANDTRLKTMKFLREYDASVPEHIDPKAAEDRVLKHFKPIERDRRVMEQAVAEWSHDRRPR